MSYTCEEARRDINFFLSKEQGEFGEKEEALLRFLFHTVEPEPGGGEKVLCNGCWQYGQNLKKEQEFQKKAD